MGHVYFTLWLSKRYQTLSWRSVGSVSVIRHTLNYLINEQPRSLIFNFLPLPAGPLAIFHVLIFFCPPAIFFSDTVKVGNKELLVTSKLFLKAKCYLLPIFHY
jgi:hypothetical protein